MTAYGKEFAQVYHDKWDLWSRMMWPFLLKTLADCGIESGRWLDLCCGTGSLARMAATRGFETIGVDVSPHQLRHARKASPATRFIQGDIRTCRMPNDCNVITCLFDSLNYITDPADAAATLANAAAHLRDAGVFIFDVKTPAAFRTEQDRTFQDPERVVVFRSEYDEATALHRFHVVGFAKTGTLYRRFEETHTQRAYTGGEIRRYLRAAGLQAQCFDADGLVKPHRASKRLIYVCRRSR